MLYIAIGAYVTTVNELFERWLYSCYIIICFMKYLCISGTRVKNKIQYVVCVLYGERRPLRF